MEQYKGKISHPLKVKVRELFESHNPLGVNEIRHVCLHIKRKEKLPTLEE